MTRTAFNRRYDLVCRLAGMPMGRPPRDFGDPDRFRKRERDPATRPSHLKARLRFPTHPYVKISKVLPQKLPVLGPHPLPPEVAALSYGELAARFLLRCRQFK